VYEEQFISEISAEVHLKICFRETECGLKINYP